jgi:periplasmic divalent cation tolerance protein
MNEHVVILVTATSGTEARRIARKLLQDKLAACVNFVPVQSMFAWKGDIEEAEEVLMIIKSRGEAFDDLMGAVRALHAYDTPEIIGMPIVMGSSDYLRWISDETTG